MRILVLTPNTPGLASEDLITYLEKTEHALDVMKHPVAPTSKRVTTFRNSTIDRGKRIVPLTYRSDVALTQQLIKNQSLQYPYLGTYDWVICLSPHLALAGLKLRKAGLVKKVVYWALDYYPKRYGRGGAVGATGLKAWAGLAVEKLYRDLESKVIRGADSLWTVQENMTSGWVFGGYKWTAPVTVVPHAITNVRTPIPFSGRKFKTGLVWTGMLRPEFGFDLVLDSWIKLTRLFPDLVLHVTSRSGIPSYYKKVLGRAPFNSIKYLGFLNTREEMEDLIANSGAALGLYLPGSYKQYSDSARVKSYAACGVPIITTTAIGNASEVKHFGAGFVIEPTTHGLIDSVEHLLGVGQLNDSLSAGAHALAKHSIADKIFTKAMESLV